MKIDRWQRVKTLFHQALDQSTKERGAFLAVACADDDDLRREIEELLDADEDSTFLESPPSLFAADATESLVGQWFGAYRLLRELGRGGMGAVYLAERIDEAYEQQVAIKLIQSGLPSELVHQRFLSERQILANLDHPNIARLLDGGATDDGRPFFVMEYIDGLPIDAYCDRHRLTIRERLRLFLPVCEAVHSAHRQLVVHRDLKSSNVLVTASGIPKLLDFGIAKLLDPAQVGLTRRSLSQFVQAPMTPEYASPEQILGQLVSTASDVYTLGVVLFRLLTGQPPYTFSSRHPIEIARMIIETVPQRVSRVIGQSVEESVAESRRTRPDRLRRQLAGDLENILFKALAKEPTERYASVEDLATDLHRHLEGLPIRARADQPLYLAGRFLKRHRVPLDAAFLVLVSLIGGLIAAQRQAAIAERERQLSESRFEDVRGLTTAFLFDFHDAIVDVPGTTAARQLVVETARSYLERLSREGRNDPTLLHELATAWTRLGRVQGDPMSANRGDTSAALDSFEHARKLFETLLGERPNDLDLHRQTLGLRVLIGRQLLLQGDHDGAREHFQEALARRLELLAQHPELDSLRREIADSQNRLGEWLYAQKQDEEALASFVTARDLRRELLAKTPLDEALKRELAMSHHYIR